MKRLGRNTLSFERIWEGSDLPGADLGESPMI